MYTSGDISSYDNRVKNSINATDLDSYEQEAHFNYTGFWYSGKELERHQKIFATIANSIIVTDIVHYDFFTGILHFQ